jgi:TatA/E family protein of Tat protein translocase
MFDLGIQELIVIFIVALLVFGPKKLPELGRTLGKGIAELKRAMHGVKEQIDAELNEIKQPMSLENDIHKTEEKKEKEASDTTNSYGTEKANDEKKIS